MLVVDESKAMRFKCNLEQDIVNSKYRYKYSLPHERSDDGRALRVRPVEQSVEEGQQAVSDEQSIASNVAHRLPHSRVLILIQANGNM